MDDNELTKLNISFCSSSFDSNSNKSATESFDLNSCSNDGCREDETIDKLVVSFDDIDLIDFEDQICIKTPPPTGNSDQQGIVEYHKRLNQKCINKTASLK